MHSRHNFLILFFILFLVAVTTLWLPIAQAQRSTPTPTRAPNSIFTRTYYVTGNSINARSCPETTCEVVTTFSRGESLRVLGSEIGTSVSGSTTWYRARHEGEDIYVHSSLVSRTRPSSSSSSVQPTRATTSGNVQPTIVPDAPAAQPTSIPEVPAAPPTENVSVAPPAASYGCNCSKSCEQMASCEEAYYQLNQCGCGRRDNDGDGVPCESICSGG